MKTVHVVPSIADASSGTTQAVYSLCKGIRATGCHLSLHVLSPVPASLDAVPVCSYPRRMFPHPRLGRSPEMLAGLREACKDADIIHNHSLWMCPNIYPNSAREGTLCKLLMQPHGTLSAWALGRSKWRKRLIGILGQYEAMSAADMWVATANEEYHDIRRLGYRQPVAIIPNGVDLPQNVQRDVRDRRRMFFLSRIHKKKNVELLLRCWASLEEKFPEWDLSIVGPDANNPYADEMKALTQVLGCRRVTFEGELGGDEKYSFMASSDCEVLPTHSENFGMVVAEALACGTPVICSQGAPWQGLASHHCGWWVPIDYAAFVQAMSEAMSLPRSVLRQMGERGRDWMARDFSWTGIGQKTKAAYEWLLGKGDKPEWVVID